jgi:hypothetical protein
MTPRICQSATRHVLSKERPASRQYGSSMDRVTTEEEALCIAQDECVRLGLPWRDPIVKRGWRWWRVCTPGGQRGGNAVVFIARKDGATRVRKYNR